MNKWLTLLTLLGSIIVVSAIQAPWDSGTNLRLTKRVRRQIEPKDELNQLFEDYYQWQLVTFPESATWIGDHSYDDRLNDLSEDAFERMFSKSKQFLAQANQLKATISDPDDITNLDELIYVLQTFVEGYPYRGFLLPISNMGGAYRDVILVLERMPNQTTDHLQNILARMQQVPSKLQQAIHLMRMGVAEGITNHNVSMYKVGGVLETYIVSKPEDSPFYKFFTTEMLPVNTDRDKLQAAAKEIITEISAAYIELRNYLAKEYKTRDQIGITSLEDGQQRYQQCIRYYTTTEMKPQEIHDLGLKEVDRIVELMKGIVTEMGYHDMTIQQFSNFIKEDDNNYYSGSKQLVDGCEDLIFNKINPQLSTIFGKQPKTPVRVKGTDIPTSAAYYESGPIDGSSPGYFVIGTADPRLWPKYSLLSLSLHEANPGHHLQLSLNNENPKTPSFRKLLGTTSTISNAPSSFPSYSAFVEGWGLYSELLGFDLQLYEDPLDRFGFYTQELLRSCRLVVDTGIHSLGWTHRQAVDYIDNLVAYSTNFIEIQVDRYVTWPGQALTYKIGQLRISGFRKRAEEALGSEFDIKEFHQLLLDNPTHLDGLEIVVQNWIDQQTSPATNNRPFTLTCLFAMTVAVFAMMS